MAAWDPDRSDKVYFFHQGACDNKELTSSFNLNHFLKDLEQNARVEEETAIDNHGLDTQISNY